VGYARLGTLFSIPPKPTAPSGNGKIITSVTWEGLQYTHPEVLLRELQNSVGKPYDSATAIFEMERLSGLDIFSNVELESTPMDSTTSLHWKFHEMPPFLPVPDAGSESGGGIALGIALVGTNITGRNIKLTSEFLWGKTKNYTLELEDPWIGVNHYTLKITSDYYEQKNEGENFFEKSSDGSVWVGRWYDRNIQVETGAGLLFLRADDVTKTLSGSGYDRNGWAGVRGTYENRNDKVHPTYGIWAQIEYKNEFVQSNYSEYTFDFRGWLPMSETLYWAHNTLLQFRSGEIGQQIPVYETYRLGGSQTIRGYDLKQLGQTQFGKNEGISTTELRWRFLPRVVVHEYGLSYPFGMEVATFIDLGEAWNGDISSLTKPAVGGGAGFRLLVPAVKEVRIDYAIGEGGVKSFMLTLGKKENWQRERIR